MPKIVDHAKRKEQIAEATWQVIRREGLDGVSVRRIAEEMGISLGALRHYFDSQEELLAFAMRLISSRVHARIRSLPFTGHPRQDLEQAIAQIAPLDEERIAECEVWLAFAGKAVSDDTIRALSQEVHEQIYHGLRQTIDSLILQGLLKPGIDPEQETRRLHALIDGLVVHCTTYPDLFRTDDLMQTVSYHLDTLFVQP
ncbi:TetR/AcrR family transcriptional regulator [Paenibacillus sp. y28]|uniref:TetR/AcrR family transcriptional regulator n=1 Tax=Paenibacillus sp. y28 TaxID=3129110 RepID=UPI003016E3DF